MHVEDIFGDLQTRLTSGEFDAGARLKPETFATQYGCSASTIRDILYRLTTHGLAFYLEQKGFRVPAISLSRRDDLTRFRIMLEAEGTCLSIRQGDIDWEARLSAAHHRLSHIEKRVRDTGDRTAIFPIWSKAEFAFHNTLIEACGLNSLITAHEMVYHQFRQQMITTDRDFAFLPETIAQHEEILQAVLDRDQARARHTITAHLSRSLTRSAPGGRSV